MGIRGEAAAVCGEVVKDGSIGIMRCEACGCDCAEKEAEIERWKAEAERRRQIGEGLRSGCRYRNTLITELADALDEIGHVTQARLSTEYWQKRKQLIERALEATK